MDEPLFSPVPFTAEVAIKGKNNGDDRVTVIHYRHGSAQPAPSVAELTRLGEYVRDNILPAYRQCVHTSCVWDEITVKYIGNNQGIAASVPLNPGVTGARGGDVSPGNVNVCLNKKTGVALRSARGRLFVPDIADGDIAASRITNGGLIAALNTFAGVLIVSPIPGTNSWRACVASKKRFNFYDIIGISFDLYTDSQYQRLLGKRKSRRQVQPAPA